MAAKCAVTKPDTEENMQSEISHFVITRIGLAIYDEVRLNKMIDLFAAVTLPSVKGQSKQDFIWLIVVDAACPVASKNRIVSLIAGHRNYHCVPLDLTNVMNVRLACFDWVWDCCQTFILENHLIGSPEEYVITSIIDADDAWNRETIAMVDRLVVARMPEALGKKDSRGTWLRHSVGLTITFHDGYVWYISSRKLWPLKNEFRSMSVFIVARFSSGISACSCRHTQWRKYSEILEFEAISLPSKEPMWIYSRHDEAVESWNARQGMQMPASFVERLEKMFGVECQRVDRWLLDYPPKEETEKHFNPSAALQYDLMFRIAARNRQIRALEKAIMCNDVNGGRQNDTLSEAQAERERLIRELQRGSR
jgi:hypothetical protein